MVGVKVEEGDLLRQRALWTRQKPGQEEEDEEEESDEDVQEEECTSLEPSGRS